MKHLLFLLLMLPAMVWAQTKKPAVKPIPSAHRQSVGMEGLGRFKINKTTTAVIQELCTELGVRLQHGYSIGRISGLADSVAVLEVDYESPDEYPDASQYSSGCPGARTVYLPNYTIADIAMKGLYLRFYKDALIEIVAEKTTDLADAFELKYGKPSLRVTTTPKPCVYTYTGNKVTYKDESFFSSWYNGAITAVHTASKYYDSECKPQFLSYLTIGDTKKAAALQQCSDAVNKAVSAKQAAAKRKKLSDL